MHEPADKQGRDYADLDIPVGKIMLFGLYIAIFTAVTFVGIKLLFLKLEADRAKADQAAAAFAQQRLLPPQPRLQVDEPLTWQQQLEAEKAQLEGYAWVNPQAGIVRIPIERAMDLVAERGLPVRGHTDAKGAP